MYVDEVVGCLNCYNIHLTLCAESEWHKFTKNPEVRVDGWVGEFVLHVLRTAIKKERLKDVNYFYCRTFSPMVRFFQLWFFPFITVRHSGG